jgi:Flp pilus assembly protein CpaB
MTYRVKNITIAVALALVAALLTMFYVTNYQRNVRQDETNVPIWVAKRDIPAGSTGAEIAQKGMLEKSEIVRRSVVPGAISNPKQIEELVASQPIYAGEQISTRRFVTPSQQGIKAQLTGVQRAIQIDGNEHQLLAGTLRAGDKVDLVATFGAGGNNGPLFTRIVLRDIEVLRAPAGVGTTQKVTSGSQGGDYSVMLKPTDTQVQKLHWVYAAAASGEAKWHLELRPGRDGADSPENVESWYSVLREGVTRNQLDEAGADNVPAIGSDTPGSESNE